MLVGGADVADCEGERGRTLGLADRVVETLQTRGGGGYSSVIIITHLYITCTSPAPPLSIIFITWSTMVTLVPE